MASTTIAEDKPIRIDVALWYRGASVVGKSQLRISSYCDCDDVRRQDTTRVGRHEAEGNAGCALVVWSQIVCCAVSQIPDGSG
jgi:hypothetical protein